MDVVNETVLANGKWHQPKKGTEKWENPWFLIGSDTNHPLNPPLYIELAFELANQYAPNTELIINQHGSMQKPMWDKIKRLVLYLRKKGLSSSSQNFFNYPAAFIKETGKWSGYLECLEFK